MSSTHFPRQLERRDEMKLITNFKYGTGFTGYALRVFLVFTLSSSFVTPTLMAADVSVEKKEQQPEAELKVPAKKRPTLSNFDSTQIQPANLNPRSSSEFYSTIPDAKLLIPIHIWGQVKEPGLHFVPLGSNLSEAISSAGGPDTNAKFPEVTLIRKGDSIEREVNVLKNGLVEKIVANDTIVLDRSLRADLPVIFGGISIGISLITLIVLLKKQ